MNSPQMLLEKVRNSHSQGEVNTELSGYKLVLARAIWVIVAIMALALWVISIPPGMPNI
jgi:hypothetical protein